MMNNPLRYAVHLLLFLFTASTVVADEQHAPPSQTTIKPNILWIAIEDWSPDLSCYGTKGIHTPHVDELASEGIRYVRAFTTSPVCSTSRSAMMTGFHQNYIGANQHREYDKKALPHGIKPIPQLMREAGYFTALMSRKTDCNFVPNTKEELFEGNDWSERKPDQPFFARITFGGTHRSWKRDPERPIDINQAKFDFNKHGWPAWYPTRTLEDWQAARSTWEPYVFRTPDAPANRPSVVYPKKTTVLIKDDFKQVELATRELSQGNWIVVGGNAKAKHESEPGQPMKKHGPKAAYTSKFLNGSLAIEFKPTAADAVVLTIDSGPATHVFRVRANVQGAAADVQPPLIATFAQKEEGAKKAKTIVLVTEGIPNLKSDEWICIEVNFLGSKAVVVVNGKTFTVRHDRIAQEKLTSKLELQHGAISLRSFQLSSF
jgi:hypothetical protein